MAMLRKLRDDFREFPATMVLGTLWALVFGAMAAAQARQPGGLNPFQFGVGPFDGHRFGDLTILDLNDGEVWRTLTATFVHFGLLHIGLNLWAFYQLGTLVESWYGSGPFVAIYVLTGAGGNLISALVRQALSHPTVVHSGGGSTVIMGLVGLCAVVGWRARTRIGEHLRRQMVWVLVLTGAMGAGFSLSGLPVIDNWGHAGGALVGAAIGLANRGLVRHAGRLSGRIAGALGTLVLAASAFALVSDDRAEDDSRRQAEQARLRIEGRERLIGRLEQVRAAYRAAASAPRLIERGALVPRGPSRTYSGPLAPPAEVNPTVDPGREFSLSLLAAGRKYLNSMGKEFEGGDSSADFQRARQLLEQSLADPPTLDEVHEFDARLAAIAARVRRERDASAMQHAVARSGAGLLD